MKWAGSVADPKTHDDLEDHKDDEGCDAAPDDRGDDTPDLDRHLAKVALKQTCCAADCFYGKDTGQNGADDASNPVHAKNVKAIVVAQRSLDACRENVATDAGRQTNDKRALGIDEA